ncbi:MAG: toll/interleukin-1 receptor domain-containing protein [candidate division Zixibacteria bacterium]|nr:toll/interleukin-1 receptor domain-containing protein [candidate division Zixibacteria bacterium]
MHRLGKLLVSKEKAERRLQERLSELSKLNDLFGPEYKLSADFIRPQFQSWCSFTTTLVGSMFDSGFYADQLSYNGGEPAWRADQVSYDDQKLPLDIDAAKRSVESLIAQLELFSYVDKSHQSLECIERIWGVHSLHLFVSHVSAEKDFAVNLKLELNEYGVSSFVAHEDVEPTREWLNEIEAALFSADALLALFTPEFPESEWTDQELGVAIGRTLPVIPIRKGMDPYGFVGKFQGITPFQNDTNKLAVEIYDSLWKQDKLERQLTDSLIYRFENSKSFDDTNRLMIELRRIRTILPNELTRLRTASSRNGQVKGAYRAERELDGLIKRLEPETASIEHLA